MNNLTKFLVALLFLNISALYSQGGASSCAELEANYQQYQSCATNVPFQNSTGGNAENFSTSCIGAPFNGPTWFFMEIETSGDIQLQISQVNNGGAGTDVDFVLWGPFNNLTNICSQLDTSTEVDCSWLPDSVETAYIPNGVAGQLYVLLVDNYANQPGNISIAQTGGTGTSNCDFLSSVKIVDTSLNEITSGDFCNITNKDLVAQINVSSFSGLPANLRFNYKWYKNEILINTITDSTSNTNTLNATDSGIYKVEITAYDSTDPTIIIADLVPSSDELDLKFHTSAVVTISNTNTQCLGTNPVLQSTIANQSNLNSTVDVLTYQWYLNNNPILGETNQNHTPTLPGDYFIRVFNTSCSNTDSNVIHIIENPDVTISSDQIFCEGDSYIITSSIPNAGLLTDISYKWFKDGTLISGATNSTYTVSSSNQNTDSTSIYTLEVTEQNLCSNLSNGVSLTINALPVVNTIPYIICADKNNIPSNSVIIDTQIPSTDFSFAWYNGHNASSGNEIAGQTGSTFETSTEGEYSVVITNTKNAVGCPTTFNFIVNNSYIPYSLETQPSELVVFEDGNTFAAIASPISSDYLYSLDDMDWQVSNLFANVSEGEHQLSVINKYNCGKKISTQLIVINYPRFFTPNGDGYHDTWNVNKIKSLDFLEISIYDRFGRFIKEINPKNGSWNGTINGNNLPASDYWFKLKYKKNNVEKEFKGHFTLKR